MFDQSELTGNIPSVSGSPFGGSTVPASGSPFGGSTVPASGGPFGGSTVPASGSPVGGSAVPANVTPVAGVPYIPASQGRDPTRVITSSYTRASYVHLSEPKSFGGNPPKYGMAIIVQKSDTGTLELMSAAVQSAYWKGAEKLRSSDGTLLPLDRIKTPIRDGDVERPNDPAYANAYFINVSSRKPPELVDSHCNPITDPNEVRSGDWCRVSISAFAFSVNGNKGISFALGNVQKIADGEALGGRPRANDDFTAVGTAAGNNDFLD